MRMRDLRPVLSICGECWQEPAKPGTAFWFCRGLKKKEEGKKFSICAPFYNVDLFDPAFTCKVRAYGVRSN